MKKMIIGHTHKSKSFYEMAIGCLNKNIFNYNKKIKWVNIDPFVNK